ncbi:hypothetical protein ACNKHV_25750 [Shigella flexneri]
MIERSKDRWMSTETLRRAAGNWRKELEEYKNAYRIDIKPSREYASTIMNAIWTGEPSVIYGNVRNDDLIDNLPQGCCVEIACLSMLMAFSQRKWYTTFASGRLMQTNIDVQTLLTEALPRRSRPCLPRRDDEAAYCRRAGH